MVHFFGILNPGRFRRAPAAEAPSKAHFFGGAGHQELTADPAGRAEQELCFLYGMAPEPEDRDLAPPDGAGGHR
ncbi:hypothetical protein SAMN05216456_0418 [Devosia crocina]|uniref:Uncharacterized protein n=1 Tax=Devosia crocina TaxID=429728 RepID=A0A1I7N025_9HYPH|nr:hypothetical protein [Devosia crocina]SFV28027.1 hypothetical protein SAMN05216456_0418 [Devosia crocina]